MGLFTPGAIIHGVKKQGFFPLSLCDKTGRPIRFELRSHDRAAAVAQKGESGGAVSKTSVNKHRRRVFWEREEDAFFLSLISENRFILACPLYMRSFLIILHWMWSKVHCPFSSTCASVMSKAYAFFVFFLFVILSYQNACYGCENAENRTWYEFFSDRRKFQRQCVNVIGTTWGCIYFLTCKNFGQEFQCQRP